MDGPGIDQKIRFGYAKAASKLGETFALYRAATPITPIQSGNLIGNLLMVATQSWDWMKGNRPGNAIWYLLVDGQDSSSPLSAQEGDYLVGDHTFFVMSKEYQMPMQGVECNSLITISRPTQSLTKGGQGYAGYTPPGSTIMFQNMPASILMRYSGKYPATNLPTDTNEPSWIVQLPNLGGVDIRTGDVLTQIAFETNKDQMTITPLSSPAQAEQTFIVSANEETEFGWRLTVMKSVN